MQCSNLRTGRESALLRVLSIYPAANLLFAFSSTAFPAWLGAYCVMGVGGVMVYISQFYLGSFFPGVCGPTMDSLGRKGLFCWIVAFFKCSTLF